MAELLAAAAGALEDSGRWLRSCWRVRWLLQAAIASSNGIHAYLVPVTQTTWFSSRTRPSLVV
jgi:hypothetical protein